MENKVISTEYVKKNFIHKDKIRKILKTMEEDRYHDDGYYIAIVEFEQLLEETDEDIN